jgi:hypothetical protein
MTFRPVSLVALALVGGAALGLAPASPAPDIAFVDVSVIPMTAAGVSEHQTVVVRGDAIVAVGNRTTVAVPTGTQVIEDRGRFLIPGAWWTRTCISWRKAISASFLAWGVTTVRNLTGSPRVLEWRRTVAAGARPGPRIVTSGPLFAGPGIP